MIKILYVHHGKGIGGAPLSLLYLIRGLDRSRFFPSVLCLYKSEAVDLFWNEGIETFIAKGIHDFSHTNVLWYTFWQFPKLLLRAVQIPFSIERARKFLLKHQFDIVHLNTSTLFAFAIAAKRTGLKIVWHIREPLQQKYFGIRRNIIRNIIHGNADCIIPICQYDADQLIPSDKIHVVYNFIDFERFDRTSVQIKTDGEKIRIALNLSEDDKIVLMLGGVNPIKGTFDFVRAAKEIIPNHSDVYFLIAGDVPASTMRNRINGLSRYFTSIKQIIQSSGLNDRIKFLGNRSDIPELLSMSNVLCFPSTVAHFARPIIEASAMGVPVVASDLGGPRELVVNGVTGFLVPSGNVSELSISIQRILTDSALATQMGNDGESFAREHFSSVKNVNQVIQLYESVLQV